MCKFSQGREVGREHCSQSQVKKGFHREGGFDQRLLTGQVR